MTGFKLKNIDHISIHKLQQKTKAKLLGFKELRKGNYCENIMER